MLLRRVIDHVKAQNWTAVALDFVIVVVGVFIGIQVANWNEARQLRAREAHYLERLDREFDVVRERLEAGREIFRRSVVGIDLLLGTHRDYRRSGDAPLPDDEALIPALDDLTIGRVPATAPAAFNEMIARGALETLDSDELRHALFAFDEFSNVALEGWRTLRDEHRDAANELRAALDTAAPETWDGNVDIVRVGFDREAFLATPGNAKHLNVLLRAQLNQYALVSRQLELAEEIEAIIAAERAK